MEQGTVALLDARWGGLSRDMKPRQAPPQRSDVAAFTENLQFNKEEALEWLKNEEQRANIKVRTATDAGMTRAAVDKAEVCAQVIVWLTKKTEEQLLKEPADIDKEIDKRVQKIREGYPLETTG